MKRTITTGAILAIIAAALLIFLYPADAKSDPTKVVEAAAPTLTPQQQTWVQALRWCESRGNDAAINKVDRDGTPSYGRFQFKPSTYAALAKRYALASTTNYMDGAQQQQIVEHMILDKSISNSELKTRQFPDCITRFIGLPPRT